MASDFLKFLAGALTGAGEGFTDVGRSRQVELERQRREEEAGMQRLIQMLGLQEKQREFDVAEQGRAEVRGMKREDLEAERAVPGLFAPVEEVQQGAQAPAEAGPPELSDVAASPLAAFMRRQREPSGMDVARRAGERGLKLSSVARAAKTVGELGAVKPTKYHTVGGALVPEPTEPGGKSVPAYVAPEKPETPSPEKDYHAIARKNLGAAADPAALAKEARRLAQVDKVEVSQEQGAIASAARIAEGKERALGPQPVTAEERQRSAEGARTIQLAKQVAADLAKNPDWVGGPFGLMGKMQVLGARAGVAPEGFAKFKARVDEMRGTYARRVAGAALTPTEKREYLAYLPDVAKDSSQEFIAKLELMPERAEALEALIESKRLGTAAPAAAPAGGYKTAPPAGGRIRVRLQDGRTGTVDASEFDPQTMTKVP